MRKSLFQLSLIGKSSLSLLEDMESVRNFLNDFIEDKNFIQFGSCFFISYDDDVIEMSNNLKKQFGDEIAFVILDITQNINVFDFVGYINDSHKNSKEFIDLIKSFANKNENNYDTEEEILSDEEKLQIAINNEDYEQAAKIRDRMQMNFEGK